MIGKTTVKIEITTGGINNVSGCLSKAASGSSYSRSANTSVKR